MATRFSREFSGSPAAVDRGFVIACAAVWLLVLGMGVAATVAFVDLGRGHSAGETGSGTSWLLYVIIAVSALVIALAIPLLLRARRAATLDDELAAEVAPVQARAGSAALVDHDAPVPAATRQTGSDRSDVAGVPVATLDRIWLRCGLGIMTAAGAGMLAVALAGYLLAVGSGTAAWVSLGVAAAITIAMVAIPGVYFKQLRTEIDSVV